METNRRNLLMGMGAVAVGGGAIMGSGAFTEGDATVTREVEVTVMAQGDLATDYVDILALASDYSSLDVAPGDDSTDPAQDSEIDDGSGYFPTTDNYYDFSGGPRDQYVSDPKDASLMANDLRLVFGHTMQLPPNSTIDYTDLFAVVNESGGSNDNSFEVEITGGNIITSTEGPKTIAAGESAYFDAQVQTGDTNDTDTTHVDLEGLVIEIRQV